MIPTNLHISGNLLEGLLFTVLFFIPVFVSAQKNTQVKETNEKSGPIYIKPNPGKISAEEILLNYVNALGGEENLLKIKDITVKYSGEANGMKISLVLFKKVPGKLIQKLEIGTINRKTVYNGKNAAVYFLGRVEMLSGYRLEILKVRSMMFPELGYKSLGINPVLIGMGKYKNRNVYKIKLTKGKLKDWFQYFDVETGLKVKEEIKIKTENGEFKEVTEFENYRPVNGVKFPYEIHRTFGNQEIEFRIMELKLNSNLDDKIFAIEE